MNNQIQDPQIAAIRRAAINVLGTTTAGQAIVQICDSHAETMRLMQHSRVPDATVIAVIGATGQGKSWLIRQWISDPAVRAVIRSGDSQSDATRRMYWVGPQTPLNLNAASENFLFCTADTMTDLGGPYVLVDTPGATDVDPVTAEASARAIAMASVLVLVVRREQVRSEVPRQLAEASDGTLVLPVVTVVRQGQDDAELRRDVDDMTRRLRAAAPRGEVLRPVLVPDFELTEESQDEVGKVVLGRIAEALRSHLGGGQVGHVRRGMRLQAERERFQLRVREQLAEQLPRLALAVQHLDEATRKLPQDVAVELIGSGQTLRAGIRARLRAEMLVSTAAIWFPFRTLLGVLNLTHGAWDRVILALSGSLPSLVGAAWTSIKNFNESNQTFQASDALRSRSSAMIANRIVPLVYRFRNELSRVRTANSASSGHTDETLGAGANADANGTPRSELHGIELLGVDSLQERTQQIFDDEIEKAAPSSSVIQFLGLSGTLLFWALLSGPIISLYRSYFAASYDSMSHLADNLDQFPHPPASTIFTSLVLSLLPTAIFAMLVLTWVQRRSRQETAARQVNARIKEAIDELQAMGVLRIDFRDPVLEDTRTLTRIGE